MVSEESEADKILESFPQEVDAIELPKFLSEHIKEISTYCGRDISPLVKHFLADSRVSQTVLHDPNQYLTIQFSREPVPSVGLPGYGDRIGVDPKKVAKSIKEAIQILNKGWGIDSGIVLEDRRALKLTSIENMTLDWDQTSALFPAFRFRLGSDSPTREDIERIIEVIKCGRAGGPSQGGIIRI